MLTENQITEILSQYLKNEGFKIIQQLKSTQRGIDIIALDPAGKRHHIEVKGETSAVKTSKRFGKEFSNRQIWSHVSVALLKTITCIHDHGTEHGYAMAFPKNHLHLAQKIKSSTDRLGITIYLVDQQGVVVV